MDYYSFCNRTACYPKPNEQINMIINSVASDNGDNMGQLCRKFKDKGEMHFGKKMWYLGETIRKLYDIDRDPERKKFLDEYFNFMRHKGATVTKIPVVAKLPLDLFRLYQVVQKLGGFAQVVKKRRWSRVVRQLDLPSSITSAAFTLRTQYMRLLYPFECEKKGLLKKFSFYDDDRSSTTRWSPMQLKYTIPPHYNPLDENRRDISENECRENSDFGDDSNEVFDENLAVYDASSPPVDVAMETECDEKSSILSMRRSRSEELRSDNCFQGYEFYEKRPHSLDNHDLPSKQEFKEIGEKRKSNTPTPDEPRDPQDQSESRESPADVCPISEQISEPNQYDIYQHANLPRMQREYETASTQAKYRDEFLPDMASVNSGLPRSYDPYTICERDAMRTTIRDTPCPCRKCIERSYTRRLSPSYTNNIFAANQYARASYGDNISPFNSDMDSQRYLPRGIKTSLNNKKHFANYHNKVHSGQSTKYKSPYSPAACGAEMNIKIEERTETAIALTIAVDGISYTGTLLSKIR